MAKIKETTEERKKRVLKYCKNMASMQAWPKIETLNPKSWLQNFTIDELPYALDILESLVVITSDKQIAMLIDAINSLFRELGVVKSYNEAVFKWEDYRNKWIVAHITKENPNPSESGFAFDRMMRQKVGICPKRIWESNRILKAIKSSPQKTWDIILVDDIVCSGKQCVTFMDREFDGLSLNKILNSETNYSYVNIYFVPLISTSYGEGIIKEKCPNLKFRPGFVMDESYSCVSEKSKVWRSDERKLGARNFIENASERAGSEDLYGICDLAYCLTFDYGPPDMSLPIIYHNSENWKNLIARK